MSKWYLHPGDSNGVVTSTRIRLARNLEDFPFPNKLDTNSKNHINTLVKDALLGCCDEDLSYIEMNTLTASQANSMAERHLVSPEFASERNGRALLLSEDESVSIMLCEEDHIRLQVMQAGLALDEAYSRADKLDNIISSKLRPAFDERIGFLTQCPTNLGTAMRASVMLHLPALAKSGQITKIASTVSKLGLTIRGAHGEGSAPGGDLYQLSNQVTLGISEQTALSNLKSITQQLVAQELNLREQIVRNPVWEDKIHRALGIMKSARLMSCEEFMQLSSLVRLGIAQKLIDKDPKIISELIVDMQPATINAREGRTLDVNERDAIRAKAVREALN